MSEFQTAYIPVGVPTFHLESAQIEFEKSVGLLSALTEHVVYPDKMLLTVEDLSVYLETIHPDLLILQNLTFANAAYACECMKRFTCPVLLWTLREPVIDGGRLRLNSLTSAYSAANAMMLLGKENFEYVFGSPEEERVKEKVAACIRAAELKTFLKELRMAAIGHPPQGFGFGRALDMELQKAFGVTLEAIEIREVINRARAYTEEECRPYLERLKGCTTGLCAIPKENQTGFARLFKAYSELAKEHHIAALASRCWPDYFTEFGTPVCAVLSMLNDAGIAASCESDVYGALSMYMGMRLSGEAVFFGDPVSLDEAQSTVTFWHCGMAPCSLARQDTGARIGVHPNRRIGPVLDFGCRPGTKATVFRIGRNADGAFRFFLLSGKVEDKPGQFTGTSIVVKTKTPARQIIEKSVADGWEPHFAVIYGDVLEELRMLGHMLDMEVDVY